MTSQNANYPFCQLLKTILFETKVINTEQNDCLFVPALTVKDVHFKRPEGEQEGEGTRGWRKA